VTTSWIGLYISPQCRRMEMSASWIAGEEEEVEASREGIRNPKVIE